MKIKKKTELVYEYTNKWNSVAVISDGTRVLGLGDIGPEAAMPVMEGKALIFKYLGGVDAVPICLDTKDPGEFIDTCRRLQPSFGGFNLEDISQPKCFDILDTLRKECSIPVWHDDQQGTATVTVAGVINSLKIVKKKLANVQITMIGAGASNICIAQMLILAGADPGKMIMCDSKGTLHSDRKDLRGRHRQKWRMCVATNMRGVKGGMQDAIRNADILIALSTPGPGLIKKEWICTMQPDAIVFSCANPVPEIWPWEAKKGSARIVATGRSDFPNQVNNSLGFPGIFRGALDVRARTITNEMCLAAAYELAKVQQDKGLDEEHILPTMDDWEVFPREACAVGLKAIEQGIAGIRMSRKELLRKAEDIIKRARKQTDTMMKEGFIPKAPK